MSLCEHSLKQICQLLQEANMMFKYNNCLHRDNDRFSTNTTYAVHLKIKCQACMISEIELNYDYKKRL
ncbi:hypothetical protein T11_15778 [Trichinella zimbabwensis]|uniref:Uncharacterized protein n=1 Tax=Trichinella zimbabwensis TaxID=268475 RepID=A0A0V1I057_9BILA|nr:hypothetical protein T11_15778 [Trichinella zimbabwensis]